MTDSIRTMFFESGPREKPVPAGMQRMVVPKSDFLYNFQQEDAMSIYEALSAAGHWAADSFRESTNGNGKALVDDLRGLSIDDVYCGDCRHNLSIGTEHGAGCKRSGTYQHFDGRESEQRPPTAEAFAAYRETCYLAGAKDGYCSMHDERCFPRVQGALGTR